MKRFVLGMTAIGAFALFACDNVEFGLVVEEVPPPDDDCGFEPGVADWPLVYDSERMGQMFIPTEVTNVLSDAPTQIVANDPILLSTPPLSVTPLRFDFRWECDSNGFTAGQGPLILPAFSTENPFCLDNRDDANSDFAGFDVVTANGAPISPSDTGIWTFDAITPQLGAQFNVAFRLAELSEDCCNLAGGCQNAPNFANQGACADLQILLDSVAEGQYSVQQPETVNIWGPYVVYTPQGTNEAGRTIIPSFPLRIRGVYEGITAAGDLITSTEFVRAIGICKGDPVGTGFLGACTNDDTIQCFQ